MTWDLRLGSCLDPVAGLASLADKSIDVTITDPPYEAEAHTKGRRVKRDLGSGNSVVEEPLPFAPISEGDRAEVARHIGRLTRRWALVFCQIEAAHKWALALSDGGLQYVRTMVWVKPDGQPQLTGDRPGMGYEAIVVAHPSGRKRWNGGGRTGVFFENKGAGRAPGTRAPHPTTKPLPLMRDLVELFSDPCDLILDPFAGTASTGVACMRNPSRRFIGWEIDAGFYAQGCSRLDAGPSFVDSAQTDLWPARGA